MVRARRRASRLTRKEGRRYTRQSIMFIFLTVLLLVALLFWGIPALIRLAIFLGDLRSSSQPVSGEDLLPPSPPILQPLPESTSSAILLVDGFAEEGTTVTLNLNGIQILEVVAGNEGDFLFSRVDLVEGENRIEAYATDQSGNRSQPSTPYLIDLDTTPPSLTVDEPQDGKVFIGSREQLIRVSGKADPEMTIEVNGSFLILAHDGSFSTTLRLTSGDNQIRIVARDRAGNQTQESRTVTFEP